MSPGGINKWSMYDQSVLENLGLYRPSGSRTVPLPP